MKQYVTAVDIGTTKIVAIAGTMENGKIKVLGTGSVPTPQDSVKRGVVLNLDQASKAIQEAVQQAEQASGIKFKSVFVGIAGQHIKSQQNQHTLVISSEGDEITQAHVDELKQVMYNVALEAGEVIIDIIPQNYTVDKESGVTQPAGMYGKRLSGNYHIVIGENTSAKNIERCVERIGLEVNDLFLEPLASSTAVLSADEKEAGVALVDIGGGTTDIAVYYDGILQHTAVIPLGGNTVTNDIKEGCSILRKTAENLKLKHGAAISTSIDPEIAAVLPGLDGRPKKRVALVTLAKIINYRMKEIIEMVNFELINSGFRNKLGAGISLTGGGALLHLLPQLIQIETGLDVKLAYPHKDFTINNPEMMNPKYSTVFGLLQMGFENLHKIKTPSDTLENIQAEQRRIEALKAAEEAAEEAARKAAEEAARKAEAERLQKKAEADKIAKAQKEEEAENARKDEPILKRIQKKIKDIISEDDNEME